MADLDDTDAPENTETPGAANQAGVSAKTPRSAKRVAAVGIPVALAAAAAVSFAGLTELGGFAGIDHPWLMPVAIDVYATTATLIAMLLPEGHHARRTAVWNARLGLAMSMGGNALARSLHLGTRGYTASDALLTFVGAWPSLIVERLLQLQGRLVVSDAGAPEATTTAAEDISAVAKQRRQDSADGDGEATPKATVKPTTGDASAGRATTRADGAATARTKTADDGATVTDLSERRRTDEDWAQIAAPHYLAFAQENGGKTPTAPQLAALLAAAGHVRLSDTRAREIRRATEKRIAEPPQDEAERDRWAG